MSRGSSSLEPSRGLIFVPDRAPLSPSIAPLQFASLSKRTVAKRNHHFPPRLVDASSSQRGRRSAAQDGSVREHVSRWLDQGRDEERNRRREGRASDRAGGGNEDDWQTRKEPSVTLPVSSQQLPERGSRIDELRDREGSRPLPSRPALPSPANARGRGSGATVSARHDPSWGAADQRTGLGSRRMTSVGSAPVKRERRRGGGHVQ